MLLEKYLKRTDTKKGTIKLIKGAYVRNMCQHIVSAAIWSSNGQPSKVDIFIKPQNCKPLPQ